MVNAAIIRNPALNNSLGARINDILGKHGLPGGMIGAQIDALNGNPLGVLNNLKDAFNEAALGRGTNRRERLLGRPLSPFGFVPTPKHALGRAHRFNGYATSRQRLDLAPGASNSPLARIFDPRRRGAAKFEAAIRKNPFLRRAFERAVGGRIRPDGRNDGKITIERRHRLPHIGIPGLQMGQTAASMLGAMDAALKNQLGALAGLPGGFRLGALGNLGQNLGAFTGLPGIGGSNNPNARPGLINNNPAGEERAHQNDVSAILADPSLTVEDKITMMIMAIMKKMDKDIQAQGEHVNKIQQQQNDKGASKGGSKSGGGGIGGVLSTIGGVAGAAFGGPIGGMIGGQLGGMIGGQVGGAGGAAGAAGAAGAGGAAGAQGGESKSIDVETMKMKRMIDKRSQMFDMLRQIIDKYNETAKGVIQSIGR